MNTTAPTRFNEAAGIPRGRRTPGGVSMQQEHLASMRPRVFPAEDADPGVWTGYTADASMRPRVFPAEDPRVAACSLQPLGASMRPRVFPAEDTIGGCRVA